MKRRSEYRREKKHLEKSHKEQGKERKYRKIISRISKQNKERWAKGVKEVERKVQWCMSRFSSPEDQNGFQKWTEHIARGPGAGRKRMH